MQDRYVGDTGDFSKYLLLKNLCKDELKLCMIWCLTERDTSGNDGGSISYLDNKNNEFFRADQSLFEGLSSIVKSTSRNVNSVMSGKILPESTIFFPATIPDGVKRFDWHEKGLEEGAGCNIIFYDPDNGLEIKSKGRLHEESVKYVFYEEIRQTYREGKSIIIYQHSNRVKNQILKRKEELCKCLNIPEESISVVYAGKGGGRYFIIIKHNDHSKIIDEKLLFLKKLPISKILTLK